jgi:hypothetical protein
MGFGAAKMRACGMARRADSSELWREAMATGNGHASAALLGGLFRGTDRVADPVDLHAHVARLEELARRLEDALTGLPGPTAATTHLLFVAGQEGYDLRPRAGPPPAVGGELELDGRRYLVQKVGRSPLPGDERRCAYLEPAGPPYQLALGLG